MFRQIKFMGVCKLCGSEVDTTVDISSEDFEMELQNVIASAIVGAAGFIGIGSPYIAKRIIVCSGCCEMIREGS